MCPAVNRNCLHNFLIQGIGDHFLVMNNLKTFILARAEVNHEGMTASFIVWAATTKYAIYNPSLQVDAICLGQKLTR